MNFQYQWLTQYTAALLGDVFEYHLFRKQIAENLKHTWPAKPFHMGPRTAPAAVAPPSSPPPPPPHCLSNREVDRTPPTEPVASLCSRSTPSGLCIQWTPAPLWSSSRTCTFCFPALPPATQGKGAHCDVREGGGLLTFDVRGRGGGVGALDV